MLKVLSKILWSCVVLILIGAVMMAMDHFLDMPDVKVSYSTGECIEVINYGDIEYTCETLPRRYNHIYVK